MRTTIELEKPRVLNLVDMLYYFSRKVTAYLEGRIAERECR